jgi:hypothetical protein
MTIHTKEASNFTVSVLRPAHQLAEKFCQHQSNLQKAEQVYLNTLAVYAVNYHLQCLGFETDWERVIAGIQSCKPSWMLLIWR